MLHSPGEQDDDGLLDLDLSGEPLEPAERDEDVLDDGVAPGGGEPAADDCTPLDDDEEQVGYELFHWDPAELDRLDDLLHGAALPHEWVSNGMELVVHEADEEAVDALVAAVRPLELDAEPDDADDADITLLQALFDAADLLSHDATSGGVELLLDAAERIDEDPPYGVDDTQWEVVVELVDGLIDLFHAGGPDEEVRETAGRLRSRLRPLV